MNGTPNIVYARKEDGGTAINPKPEIVQRTEAPKGKASEALLSQLHGSLASLWLAKLRERPEELTSAELNTIRQFLKDNDITCGAPQNEAIGSIIDLLPKFDREEAEEYI